MGNEGMAHSNRETLLLAVSLSALCWSASAECCDEYCNSCYLRIEVINNVSKAFVPNDCNVYSGNCGGAFQQKNEAKWCFDQDVCYAEHSEDCCESRTSAGFWTVSFILLLYTACGVLACCFFCEQCPLSEYYVGAEDEQGLFEPARQRHPEVVVQGVVVMPPPPQIQTSIAPAQQQNMYGAVPVQPVVAQPHDKNAHEM